MATKVVGRPTSYTEVLGDEICGMLAEGVSLKRICDKKGMPERKTIYNWFRVHPEFLHNYTRAKEDSADALADDIEDIAHGVLSKKYDPASARVAIDGKKWIASKLKAKKYGEHLDIDTKQEITHKYGEMDDDQLEAIIQARKDRAA